MLGCLLVVLNEDCDALITVLDMVFYERGFITFRTDPVCFSVIDEVYLCAVKIICFVIE